MFLIITWGCCDQNDVPWLFLWNDLKLSVSHAQLQRFVHLHYRALRLLGLFIRQPAREGPGKNLEKAEEV